LTNSALGNENLLHNDPSQTLLLNKPTNKIQNNPINESFEGLEEDLPRTVTEQLANFNPITKSSSQQKLPLLT
jgi:hypothetical protein